VQRGAEGDARTGVGNSNGNAAQYGIADAPANGCRDIAYAAGTPVHTLTITAATVMAITPNAMSSGPPAPASRPQMHDQPRERAAWGALRLPQ